MARIRPFTGIRPNLPVAQNLLFPQTGEEQSFLQATLERLADQGSGNPEKQYQLYDEIKKAFLDLIKNSDLVIDDRRGIYVYEFRAGNSCARGIWALTAVDDYRKRLIKVHEQTFAAGIRQLMRYRRHAKIEGTPILLTYQGTEKVKAFIDAAITGTPIAEVSAGRDTHRLWLVSNETLLASLITDFREIQTVYLADGHHRTESAANLTTEKGLDYISSLYIAAEQLRFGPFFRAVLPPPNYDIQELWNSLFNIFTIIPSPQNEPVIPRRRHLLGMCVAGRWYRLLLRPCYQHPGDVKKLDVEILHEFVLAPLLGIASHELDSRMDCVGGENALDTLTRILTEKPEAIGFTLFPLSAELLMEAAEAGRKLPPKASWIGPKIPFGFLFYHPEIS